MKSIKNSTSYKDEKGRVNNRLILLLFVYKPKEYIVKLYY